VRAWNTKTGWLGRLPINDSDGSPKLVVEISDDVGDIRMSSTDENRIHFIDFIRKTETTEAAPTPAPTAPSPSPTPAPAGNAAAVKPNVPSAKGAGVRVIVIDPGHGGTDTGISTTGVLEKDLTLALARKLPARTSKSAWAPTVLLTRDSDVPLNSEARTAVANNNQADLFISIHIGFFREQGRPGVFDLHHSGQFRFESRSGSKRSETFSPVVSRISDQSEVQRTTGRSDEPGSEQFFRGLGVSGSLRPGWRACQHHNAFRNAGGLQS
jgi:N-acetylmuramoyl-L-alanine amidase